MTWLAKLWAKWFCKYSFMNKHDYPEFIGCWCEYDWDYNPQRCVGIKCKGCPLPRKGGKNGL